MGFLDKMAEVGNKIGTTATKIAGDVADKSKVVAEKAKLKNEISKEQSNITKQYTEIGIKFFDANKGNVPDEYAQFFDAVLKSQQAINEHTERIKELDELNVCQKCGAKLKNEQTFCHICGARTSEEEAAAPAAQSCADQSCADQSCASSINSNVISQPVSTDNDTIQVKPEDIEIK